MLKHVKHVLIPHKGNDHHPHILRSKAIAGLTAGIVVFEFLFLVVIFSTPRYINFLASILPTVLVELTNEARAESQVGTLSIRDELTESAQAKANDMAQKGYFAHVSPDGSTPWDFIDATGYEYTIAGENLAVNFVDSEDVHDAWMNSQTHKENILRDSFTEIGIATATGTYQGHQAIFVVQHFGHPVRTQPKSILNVASATQTQGAVDGTTVVQTSTPLASIVAQPSKEPQLVQVTPPVDVIGIKVAQSVGEAPTTTTTPKKPSLSTRVLSQPRRTSNILLVFIGFVILGSATMVFFLSHRKHHAHALLHGSFAVAVILGVLLVNQYLGVLTGIVL